MVFSNESVSWIALLPSIATILLAFITKEVLVALFTGILVGGLVLFLQTNNLASLNVVKIFIVPSLSSEPYAIIVLIYLWCVGGMMGIWSKTGSAEQFATELGKKVAQGPKSSLVLAWMLGLLFHQGGSTSTILTGTTVKPVADHYKVSHEELAYVVDSTASPVAALIPFNPWPVYLTALITGTTPFIPTLTDAYDFYISSLRFNFYSIFAIIFTFLFAIGALPWVGSSMQKAINRARKYKLLDNPQATPLVSAQNLIQRPEYIQPNSLGFTIPIFVLLTVSIFPFCFWKLGYISQEYSLMTNEAFVLAILSCIIIAKCQGVLLKDILDGFIEGSKEMVLGAIILGMAMTLGEVAKQVHTADYLIQLISESIPASLLPTTLVLLCMIISFSTGTSFGTYAVVLPIAMPLAFSVMNHLTYLKICFACVLGGTLFGDQCSPISDTTILTSMFTGCDLLDHVKTQLPLALAAAFLSIIAATISVLILVQNTPPALNLLI